MRTESDRVYVVVRACAEESDWQRDSDESLTGWAFRTIRRAQVVPKLEADRKRLVEALRNAAAELRKSSESMPSTISKGVIVRACNEYDALLREIGESA